MMDSGQVKEDPYALQKCVSKAIRNAYRIIIPEYVARGIIDEWVKHKNNTK